MVLQSVVNYFLDKYLGDYFENVDPKKLKLDLWKGQISSRDRTIHFYSSFVTGNVVLEDLQLKPNLLVRIPRKNDGLVMRSRRV